jgi:hypothetical protein
MLSQLLIKVRARILSSLGKLKKLWYTGYEAGFIKRQTGFEPTIFGV